MWRCPVCGQQFVTRNMPHSCAVVGLDRFFEGSDLRALFDRFVAAMPGPVIVNATKSRITLQTRMRFAGLDRPRKRYLLVYFVLTRPVESERLARVEPIPPYYYVHRLRLSRPEDIDDELRGWLAEAYEVGEQRHVTDPEWPKVRTIEPMSVRELRVAVTADDYEQALAFYRDVLGLREREAFSSEDGRVTILEAGRATLELLDPRHAAFVDEVEVGRRVAGHVRIAFEVDDSDATTRALAAAGATVVAEPTRTPWNSLNARLEAPAGLQLTLFTELGES